MAQPSQQNPLPIFYKVNSKAMENVTIYAKVCTCYDIPSCSHYGGVSDNYW